LSNLAREADDLLDRLGQVWDLPDLGNTVDIRFSRRLHRSLARCRPGEGRITLNSDLQAATPDRFAEVLCHELAHVAVHRLHGDLARPHGPEWRGLVELAGFEPEVRAPDPSSRRQEPDSTRDQPHWKHRCPVCQNVRWARKPVTTWRCAECLDAGLDGRMVITRATADERPAK
jgi:predicted SprT family Zn-dependent metalloprotease